jgi:hypothetical protein
MADVWAQEATVSALTSFSPFPSTFATTVGEYLMALPPMLEVLVPDEDDALEEHSLASQWLDRAATAVADDLRGKVMAIQKLGSRVSS